MSAGSSCTLHRKGGRIFGVFQHKERFTKNTQDRNVGVSPPCAAEVRSQHEDRHWLGMCSSAASPAAQLQNAAALSSWKAHGKPRSKHILVMSN